MKLNLRIQKELRNKIPELFNKKNITFGDVIFAHVIMNCVEDLDYDTIQKLRKLNKTN